MLLDCFSVFCSDLHSWGDQQHTQWNNALQHGCIFRNQHLLQNSHSKSQSFCFPSALCCRSFQAVCSVQKSSVTLILTKGVDSGVQVPHPSSSVFFRRGKMYHSASRERDETISQHQTVTSFKKLFSGSVSVLQK